MNQYPVILIPERIQELKLALPPVPPAPIEPIRPGNPPVRPQEPRPAPRSNMSIQIFLIVATLLSALFIYLTSQSWWLLFIPILFFISYQTRFYYLRQEYKRNLESYGRQLQIYNKRMQLHRQNLNSYPLRLEQYRREQQLYEETVQVARTPERIAEYYFNCLLQLLRETKSHDGDNSDAPTGRREREFGKHLIHYFPGKIHTQLKVQNPRWEGFPYTPDFAYIDLDIQMYIDIELDEPYAVDGTPIHFIGLRTELDRNNHFVNERGWIVIRFAEEQVARYPHSCCKKVATVISEITNNYSILNHFVNVPDLQFVSRWTEEESKQMYLQNFRDAY